MIFTGLSLKQIKTGFWKLIIRLEKEKDRKLPPASTTSNAGPLFCIFS